MPYIPHEHRARLSAIGEPMNPGELNYLFSMIIDDYLDFKAPLSYQIINDVLGALEGAKLEFYRRIAVPYEQMKKAQNGDVYDV